MRSKFAISLGLLMILLFSSLFLIGRNAYAATSARQFTPTDVGGLPPLLNISKLLGSDQSNRTLQMSVNLALRNQYELNALLRDLYDPSSPNYHQFLTVAEFAQRFGPTAEQQQAVEHYLTRQGFTVTQTYPNRLIIDFSGPQSLAEQTFGVAINDYQTPTGRDFFANATVPALPAYLADFVSSIGGLDNANQFYHPPITSQSSNLANNPNAGTCPSPGVSSGGSGGGGIFGGLGGNQVAYIPNQFAKAYNYDGLHNAGLQGNGQTVGVFELDGYSQSDVQAYTQCFGGGSVPVQNVILDGFNGQPGAGAIEVELDMEAIMSMAPKLAKMIVYEAPNTTQGYNDEFARIVSDRTPVISVSWGDCEKNMGQQEVQQENKYFQEAAAQGQSILVASGDSGSSSCFQLGGSSFDTSLNADDPAGAAIRHSRWRDNTLAAQRQQLPIRARLEWRFIRRRRRRRHQPVLETTRLAERPRHSKPVFQRYARDAGCLARCRSRHRLPHLLYGWFVV